MQIIIATSITTSYLSKRWREKSAMGDETEIILSARCNKVQNDVATSSTSLLSHLIFHTS